MKPNSVGHGNGMAAVDHPQETTGLMANAIIMTLEGEMPVSDAKPGTRVITRDSGMAVVRAATRRRAITDTVRIRAGSLGHTRPERDVTLPAGQPVLIRDWRARALFGAKQAMIVASRLVDGEFVTRQRDVALTVYDLIFDSPHVLYVDGLEVASHVEPSRASKAA